MSGEMPTDQTLREIIELACRAPSIHNSQPWSWRQVGPELRLFADYARAVPVADPHGRQLIISVGAALHHLCVAAAAQGWVAEVTRLPSPPHPEHLATVEFVSRHPPSAADRARAAAITDRFTDRLPMQAPPQSRLRDVIGDVSSRWDIRLVAVTAEVHPTLAHASRISAFNRRYDASYQDELRWWTSDDEDRDDGIPASSLTSPVEIERVEVARDFPSVATVGSRRADVAVDRANVLVVTGPDDTVADHLACGEALSDLLLESTVAGLGTCVVSHVLEVPASRAMVDRLVGAGAEHAQLLVRVGIGEGHRPPSTPRRPVDEVFATG